MPVWLRRKSSRVGLVDRVGRGLLARSPPPTVAELGSTVGKPASV